MALTYKALSEGSRVKVSKQYGWGRNWGGAPLLPSSTTISFEKAEGHTRYIDFDVVFGRMWWKTQISVFTSAKASLTLL